MSKLLQSSERLSRRDSSVGKRSLPHAEETAHDTFTPECDILENNTLTQQHAFLQDEQSKLLKQRSCGPNTLHQIFSFDVSIVPVGTKFGVRKPLWEC